MRRNRVAAMAAALGAAGLGAAGLGAAGFGAEGFGQTAYAQTQIYSATDGILADAPWNQREIDERRDTTMPLAALDFDDRPATPDAAQRRSNGVSRPVPVARSEPVPEPPPSEFAARQTATVAGSASQGIAGPFGPLDLRGAEQLRGLDIMLMVTSLRCRMGSDSFQADYDAFATAQLPHLNEASRRLESDLSDDHGVNGARRALDRVSVDMANRFGQGHPWLDCGELRDVARWLRDAPDRSTLLLAAEELLADRPRVALAGGR